MRKPVGVVSSGTGWRRSSEDGSRPGAGHTPRLARARPADVSAARGVRGHRRLIRRDTRYQFSPAAGSPPCFIQRTLMNATGRPHRLAASRPRSSPRRRPETHRSHGSLLIKCRLVRSAAACRSLPDHAASSGVSVSAPDVPQSKTVTPCRPARAAAGRPRLLPLLSNYLWARRSPPRCSMRIFAVTLRAMWSACDGARRRLQCRGCEQRQSAAVQRVRTAPVCRGAEGANSASLPRCSWQVGRVRKRCFTSALGGLESPSTW